MKFACGLVGADWLFFAHNDCTFVDFLVEEECGQSSFFLSVYDGEVDGRRAAILGQERSVKVECAEAGHLPNHGWQHPEGHHHKEVGFQS